MQLGFRHTRNPFLACVVATKKIVDPLFVSIWNGIRLCRLVAKHAPGNIDGLFHGFSLPNSKYQGVASILSNRLQKLGWGYEDSGIWSLKGMKFHLFMSSSKHILFLLERSWLFFVCDKVRHRKWLGGISSIFRMHLKHLDNLSPSQRSLLHFQSCGEQFTNDAKKYFGDVSATCPYCGRADDSRMHRFVHCEYFQPIRSEFPIFFFFLARCCLGQVPGGAPFSQRSEQATACTNRMQIRN